MSIIRGIIGIIVLLFIAFLFSKNRKSIDWKMIATGLTLQFVFAVGVLYVPWIETILSFMAKVFIKALSFSKEGSVFLFGDLAKSEKIGYVFAFQVLPSIIYFSSLISLLYYCNVIQIVVRCMSWCLRKFLKISGAEGLISSISIFVGITEIPLIVRAYLPKMTASELFLMMTAGMSTIAGGVMAAYVGMLGGPSEAEQIVFAKHLFSASLMAIPGTIVVSKLIMPQTEQGKDIVAMEHSDFGLNVLDAIMKGALDGMKMVVSIAAALLVFISFVALANYLLSAFVGAPTGLNDLVSNLFDGHFKEFNFQFVLGLIFSPIAWLMGVCHQDMLYVGQLLGEQIVLNEFVGYESLSQMKNAGLFMEPKSIVISTYMLCGFANIGSIAIMIGGVSVLAPMHKKFLIKYGPLSMVAGVLVSCLCASIVGLFI